MNFGKALEALKEGKKVARRGWNGKGMFLYYVPANRYTALTDAAKEIMGENQKYLTRKSDEEAAVWADVRNEERSRYAQAVKKASFDVKEQAEKMQEFYLTGKLI